MSEKSVPETRSVDGDTRRHIMLMLLKHGPSTASDLAAHLDMSAAGVRRHLDILVSEGLGETVDRRPRSATAARGRPAKAFRLTARGRSHFGHSYDQLAADALGAIRELGGEEAVRKLAHKRIKRIVDGVTPAGEDEESIQRTAGELADAFDRHGYATTVTRAGAGIQICQHHCPVAHVAAEHPELCVAEHEIISSLVGLHVQPLATITGGHGICTTNIPLTPIENLPEERSGS
ncbi:Bacterial regulatory protein, arsR family [Corynebacterium comes]|uniref:Bacterial regulatory protein, arsR family n=1 Tax=Corynebacterium comes TaxID=2675218 RepID=A0A6B8W474_9CORY|nr:metalloregulator ArsR/SmtB family transcription factor [Corynebacterium comes]QGU04650.1 Bacterial regulatory protein, arsR family [Corynebacterium comes]